MTHERIENPNPLRVFGVALAQGILLWEDSLEEKSRNSWMHRRQWERSADSFTSAHLVGLTMAKAALSLYADPDWTAPGGKESVHDYARDFFNRFCRTGSGFAGAILEVADGLAKDYSPCIDLQYSMRGGSWYAIGECDRVRAALLDFKEDPILVRFVERFEQLYPETAELVRNTRERGQEKPWQLVSDLYDEFDALAETRQREKDAKAS